MSSKKPGTGKKRVGAKKAQKFQSIRSDDLHEDLDLDVDEYFPEEALPTAYDGKEEERVVLNKRAGKKGSKQLADDDDEDEDVHAVLPNDAHRGVHAHEDEDAAVEEAALAAAKSKKARKSLAEDDFDLDGISAAPKMATKAAAAPAKKAAALEEALETVQRDLSHLSTADRRALIEKESPEVIKLLDEYKTYLAEVTTISKPLHELIHSKKVTSAEERNLLAFLETKAQLLLSYCMHVSFYLLLKAEGKPVANHPVIDRLVELRVYIEKLWPLEQKLQYSLNKLIAQGPTAAAAGAGVKLADLRPVSVEEGALYKPSGAKLDNDDARQRRLARRQMQEDEELRQAEEEAMVRVQKKKGSRVDSAFLEHAAEDGYREDDDQFFSRMVADDGSDDDDDDADAHLSLIERLRAKADKKRAVASSSTTASSSAKPTSSTAGAKRGRDEEGDSGDDYDDEDEDDEDFGEDDEDLLDGMDEEGEEDDDAYEQLLEENRAIKRQKDADRADREAASAAYEKNKKSLDRRKISKSITTHRGLTKVRPKDRKTPHLAQRHKYDKGLAKARNMSKSYKPEEAGGFSGVSSFRSNVTHGTKL